MLAQQLAERAIADLGDEPGRALDIAEPERLEQRLLTHAATIRAIVAHGERGAVVGHGRIW